MAGLSPAMIRMSRVCDEHDIAKHTAKPIDQDKQEMCSARQAQ